MTTYREIDGNIVREYKLEEEEHLIRKQTDRAFVEVVPTKEFGQALFINNELQFTEKDEYIYHEALVHPCLSLSHYKKKICILGGGDGCALREVLKWKPYIESVDLIDWDNQVTELFKHTLASLNSASLHDPILTVENCDVRQLLHAYRYYDCMIIDLLDPNPEEEEHIDVWYDIIFMMKHWVPDGGCVVINAGGLTPWNVNNVAWLVDLLQEKCDWPMRLYKTFVPSFGREWCFILLTKCPTKTLGDIPENCHFLDPRVWKQMNTWSRDYFTSCLGLKLSEQEEEEEEDE